MDKADAFNFRLGMLAADVLASRTIMAGVLTQEKMADGFGILLGVPVAGPNTDNVHATMEGISLVGLLLTDNKEQRPCLECLVLHDMVLGRRRYGTTNLGPWALISYSTAKTVISL